MSNTPAPRAIAFGDILAKDAPVGVPAFLFGPKSDGSNVRYPNPLRSTFFVGFFAEGIDIGDGLDHPLSEKFSSLTLAQAVYPKATALTETFAWHAHQKAIDAAVAAGGGTVYTPRGKYIMRGPVGPYGMPLKFPLCASNFRQPQIPAAGSGSVNWVGDGEAETSITFPTDAGTTGTSFAIMCGEQPGDFVGKQANSRYGDNASDAAGASFGYFRGMTIVGPSAGLSTLGAVGCAMSGLCWAPQRELYDFRVTGFYAGIDIVGDHTPWYNVQVFGCYYGWYFSANSTTRYGDVTAFRCQIEACRKACVAFHYQGAIGTWTFAGRCFLGTSPIVFLKEATPLDADGNAPTGNAAERATFMSGVNFGSTFIESIGNYVFYDENWDKNGYCRATIDRLRGDGVTFPGWRDDKKIAGMGRQLCKVSKINSGSFLGITKMESTGITGPLWEVVDGFIGEMELSGDVDAWLADAASAGQLFLKTTSARMCQRMRLRSITNNADVGGWEGRFYNVYKGQVVAANDVVGSGGSTNFDSCGKIAESTTDMMFVGIARSAASPANATECRTVAVATGGSGYAVGDTITLTGGTFTTAAVLKVQAIDALNGNTIKRASITTPGSYTANPSNPVAQGTTSGSGVGATFTLGFSNLVTPVAVAEGGTDIPVNCDGTAGTDYDTNEMRSLGTTGKLRRANGRADGTIIGRTGNSRSNLTFSRQAPATPQNVRVQTKTAAYTLAASDNNSVINVNSSSALTISIPANLPAGFSCSIKQKGAGQVTLALVAGGTIEAYPSGANKTAGQNAIATLYVESNAGTAPVVALGGAIAV